MTMKRLHQTLISHNTITWCVKTFVKVISLQTLHLLKNSICCVVCTVSLLVFVPSSGDGIYVCIQSCTDHAFNDKATSALIPGLDVWRA